MSGTITGLVNTEGTLRGVGISSFQTSVPCDFQDPEGTDGV